MGAAEMLHAGITFEYKKGSKFSLALEPRIALFKEGVIPFESQEVNLVGVGFEVFYGRKIQLGFRTMFGFYTTNQSFDYQVPSERILHPVITTSFIVFRIALKND